MTYSYTDLLTFQRCPKKYELSVVRNLQRKAKNTKLTLGIMFHELLMGYYTDTYMERADAIRQQVLDGMILEDEVLTANDLFDDAQDMVERYVEHYQEEDEEWEVLHVENTFLVTTDSGIEISFTPDLVIRNSTGVWIVDHKTAARIPEKLPTENLQALLYSSVMRDAYPDFRGFIFNYVRKKRPVRPRLTKTGNTRVADVMRVDTTFELLRDFISENAPKLFDDPIHRQRLADLKDRNTFFFREYVFTTPEMAQQILREAEGEIALIEKAEETGIYPRVFLPYAGGQGCDRCPFNELCIGDLRGYDVEQIMFLYEERDMSHRTYDHELEELYGRAS